jgi:hypothetical protein
MGTAVGGHIDEENPHVAIDLTKRIFQVCKGGQDGVGLCDRAL